MTQPAVVVTVSSQVADGSDADRAGPVAVELLAGLGFGARVVVVPDEPERIGAAVRSAVDSGARLVLTCGGTGVGPHDHTPDVVTPMLDLVIPGIGEEVRRRGLTHTPQALVSREVAGAIRPPGRPPVLVLVGPGSRGGVRDVLGVVGPQLGYVLDQLDGAGHR